MDVFAGGVGVIEQFATLLGSPWHPANALRMAAAIVMPISTTYLLPFLTAITSISPWMLVLSATTCIYERKMRSQRMSTVL